MPRSAAPPKKAAAQKQRKTPKRCQAPKAPMPSAGAGVADQAAAAAAERRSGDNDLVRQLEEELRSTKDDLQSSIARMEASNESLEQKVRERTVQLRALTVELSLAEERERRSLAQDLHDDLGQVLAIIKHKLTALHGRERGAGLPIELKAIEDLIDQANKSMRTLAFQLSPPVLHTLGLIPALEWLTEDMERVYALKVRLSDDGAPKPLDEPSRTTLFRAVRELLINVAKHAGTGTAEVTSLRSGSRLTLAVNDDGGGFDYQKALQAAPGTGGLGLVSLRERIEFIGGEMHVDSRPNDGTTITLIAPLQDAAAEAAV
jgi:signal transduction histidine kinase